MAGHSKWKTIKAKRLAGEEVSPEYAAMVEARLGQELGAVDQLVSDVAKALGTSTKRETVNAALRDGLENRRRALALTRLRAAAEDGAFDLGLFEDKGNYRR